MRGCVVSALDRITDFGSDNTPVRKLPSADIPLTSMHRKYALASHVVDRKSFSSHHLVGQTAPVLTHASASSPASLCVPGTGCRPNPGAQPQPTSVSVPIWCTRSWSERPPFRAGSLI